MNDLTGQLLIAMPGMTDPRFDKSVIFLCEHSDKGAMGLIVNKPTPELPIVDLLKQLGIEAEDEATDMLIHFGGPVEHGRGFVLHSREYKANESTLEVTEGIGMTATLDILRDIADGVGPRQAILALGYAGWGPGQLEGEFQDNGWLSCDASAEIVFHPDDDAKWMAALGSMGVDALTLSAEAGHA
ncbi:MAG: YqgE/AlgH family protein [Pseudomonadota bacterium]